MKTLMIVPLLSFGLLAALAVVPSASAVCTVSQFSDETIGVGAGTRVCRDSSPILVTASGGVVVCPSPDACAAAGAGAGTDVHGSGGVCVYTLVLDRCVNVTV